MYKKILSFFILSFLVYGLSVSAALAAPATPATPSTKTVTNTYGLEETAKQAGLTSLGISSKDPIMIASDIISAALSFLGIVFFLLIFYAGIRWMTAMGDSGKVDKAKEMLEGAGIGLLIVIASYALARFIFTNLGLGS